MSWRRSTLLADQHTPGSAAGTREYEILGGPPEPVALFGRLAKAGIRLWAYGEALCAEVPGRASGRRSWPALERQLERHAASLAVTARLAHGFPERHPPHRVSELLAELRLEVAEILRETAGGEERLSALISTPPVGADLDLACVACCRGLAIRAIRDGQGLVGLLEDDESHEREDPRRGPEAAASCQGWSGGRDAREEQHGDRPGGW